MGPWGPLSAVQWHQLLIAPPIYLALRSLYGKAALYIRPRAVGIISTDLGLRRRGNRTLYGLVIPDTLYCR